MAALFCSVQNPLHVVRTKQCSGNENEINRNTSNELSLWLNRAF
jgi:hypothetical protein